MGCGVAKPFRKGSVEAPGFHKSYCFVQKLGQGSYSSVFLVRAKASRNIELAVKAFDSTGRSVQCDVEAKHRLRSEVEILKMLRNELHCVQIVDFYEEGHLGYIVMERCTSSLPIAMEAVDEITVPVLANCLSQMLQGLGQVHMCGVAHRDVKPSNFLVNGILGRNHIVKLCDFGLATSCTDSFGRNVLLWDVCGTMPFCAPEMLNFSGYGARVDIWSVGVIAHLFLLGKYVYMPRPWTMQNIRTSIQEDRPKPTFKPACGLPCEHITSGMVSFLEALLNRDPSQRVSANKAMKLDWLRFYLRAGRHSQRQQGTSQVSLKPMLNSAKKLGAFNDGDRASTMNSFDRQMYALQSQAGQTIPRDRA